MTTRGPSFPHRSYATIMIKRKFLHGSQNGTFEVDKALAVDRFNLNERF